MVPLPFEDEVKLLAELVVVTFRRLADGDGGFGEAWFCTGAFVRSRMLRMVLPSLVVKGFCAERGLMVMRRTVLLLRLIMANGFPLKNCRAVITGASSGLGVEFARQLAPQAEHWCWWQDGRRRWKR
jgi:hypothetical protein